MKNILKLPSKIVVKFSTLLTIIIALLINRHRLLFLQYLIAFIHELSHCVGAIFYNHKINKIVFLPFGFYADIDDFYNLIWYKELIIVILGPLSYFISLFFINYLYINNKISLVLYNEIKLSNDLILIFNLLPIFPLDGYRILKIIFEFFITEKKVLKIMSIISFISTIFLLIYCINTTQIFIISFMIYNQIILIISFKKIYRNFLISRTIDNKSKKTKIHFMKDLYRPFNNLIINYNKIYNEKEYSIYLLGKLNKN